MLSAGSGLVRRSAVVVAVVAALLCTGGVAVAQQVPPSGVVPAPPAVPPATLPPEAGPAGEAVAVPGTFACSIPGGIVSISRFAAAAAGLTQLDVDAVSPWFLPLYSACLAFPPPVEPTQCDVDRELRANGYGPNGLPITIFFPDPVGMLVTPIEVAEREAAANVGALPASPGGAVSTELGCEQLRPVRPAATDEVPGPSGPPALPLPSGVPAAVAGASEVAAADPSAASTGAGGAVDSGPATDPAAAIAGSAPSNAAATAASALPAARNVSARGGNRYLQNLLTVLAGIVLVALLWGAAVTRRTPPPAR